MMGFTTIIVPPATSRKTGKKRKLVEAEEITVCECASLEQALRLAFVRTLSVKEIQSKVRLAYSPQYQRVIPHTKKLDDRNNLKKVPIPNLFAGMDTEDTLDSQEEAEDNEMQELLFEEPESLPVDDHWAP
jgi:hypothetical protein